MRFESILKQLRSLANSRNLEGMARYGINAQNALGISIATLRPLARKIGKNHQIAEELWSSGIHEARILASIVDEPTKVTEEQMEKWVAEFDSWDVCDQVCSNLFDKTPFAYRKVEEWSNRDEEFVKRAAFALIAALTVHDKRASDEAFHPFLPIIRAQAEDDRNYVRKAVNWALRQIGKRSAALNEMAITEARSILTLGSKSARWVASDALRELTSDKVQQRLRYK